MRKRKYKVGDTLSLKDINMYPIFPANIRIINNGTDSFLNTVDYKIVNLGDRSFRFMFESTLDSHYSIQRIDCSKLWKEIND